MFPEYGSTARLIFAVWRSEANEPVKVREAVDGDTYAADVNVSCPDCPGVTCRLVGETETPAGSPVTPIVTGEVNPFEPATVTEAVVDEPATTFTFVFETERLKSGLGLGGGCTPPPDPPPQPQSIEVTSVTTTRKETEDVRKERSPNDVFWLCM